MVFLNGVHFGHIQTEMLLIHISRTFLESLGIGKWPFFDDHDVIPFLSDFVFGELHSDSLYLRKSFISRPGIRATPVGTSENKKLSSGALIPDKDIQCEYSIPASHKFTPHSRVSQNW